MWQIVGDLVRSQSIEKEATMLQSHRMTRVLKLKSGYAMPSEKLRATMSC